MSGQSFDDPNSAEARQHLLDRRCERKHPKRHRTLKRAKALAKRKRQRVRHENEVRAAARRAHVARVRKYWAGESDNHP